MLVTQPEPNAHVPAAAQSAAPELKEVVHPGGNAGGVTESKVSFTCTRMQGLEMGVGEGVGVGVTVVAGVGTGVEAGGARKRARRLRGCALTLTK